METETMNLGDIPDLSDLPDERPEPWQDGWYKATILNQRTFTDKNGNDRCFESNDTPAQKTGRNIRLQCEIKRLTDGKTMNQSLLINYRPEDFSEKHKLTDGTADMRLRLTLTRMSRLQQVAGVRQLQRSGDGGINLTPLFTKTVYVKLGQQEGTDYKEIKDFDFKVGPKTRLL